MDQRLNTYLRPLRRRVGFTQREVAFLIGVKSAAVISRLEREKRLPSLATTFAFGVVFDATPAELFPSLLSEVDQAVLRNASILYEELQGDSRRATRVKLDFLEDLLSRPEGGAATNL